MHRKALSLFLLAAVGLYLALTGALAVAAEFKEWDKVLEAAKKEGRVVVAGQSDYHTVFAEFRKKHPQIKLVSIPGRGELAARIMAERRAKKYLVDVYISGAGTMYNVLYKGKALEPIKPALILPEVLDESKWWGGKRFYRDDEENSIFPLILPRSSLLATTRSLLTQVGSSLIGIFSIQGGRERSCSRTQPLLGVGRRCGSFTTTLSLDQSLSGGFLPRWT